MKNAGIKSKAEAARRLIDGEVFYFDGIKIFFDKNRTPPFRYDGASLHNLWNKYEKWQTKPDWRDEVSKENPVLCWVWNDESQKGKVARWVCQYQQGEWYPYINITNTAWKHAEPVKPEECWQGDEE